jgi:hypothetical protein
MPARPHLALAAFKLPSTSSKMSTTSSQTSTFPSEKSLNGTSLSPKTEAPKEGRKIYRRRPRRVELEDLSIGVLGVCCRLWVCCKGEWKIEEWYKRKGGDGLSKGRVGGGTIRRRLGVRDEYHRLTGAEARFISNKRGE